MPHKFLFNTTILPECHTHTYDQPQPSNARGSLAAEGGRPIQLLLLLLASCLTDAGLYVYIHAPNYKSPYHHTSTPATQMLQRARIHHTRPWQQRRADAMEVDIWRMELEIQHKEVEIQQKEVEIQGLRTELTQERLMIMKASMVVNLLLLFIITTFFVLSIYVVLSICVASLPRKMLTAPCVGSS